MSLATISLLLLLFSASISANEKPSAYEELQNYDFPIGILPKGVTGYELNPKTGEFSAYFNGSCRFMLSSYELNYKHVIKGVISKGRLRKLSGVNIVEVRRKGDNLQFSVGITSANFPIRSFVECPSYECGLDFIHEDERKFRQKLHVSSS